MGKPLPSILDKSDVSSTKNDELILHNDDFNTFDFVIQTLIEVCDHTPEQAEQCAITAHTKGKCCIKTGDRDYLLTFHNQMISRGLSTTIG